MVVDSHDPFILYVFAVGHVHPSPQEVVPGHKHTPGHRIFDRLLGSLPGRYQEGPSLTLDEDLTFVRVFLDMSGLGGSAGAPMSQRGPLVDNGRLDEDDDWYLWDLLTSGPPDPHSALNPTFALFALLVSRVVKAVAMANVVGSGRGRG